MKTSSASNAVPGPAPGKERILALDAMRGVATLGVLLAYTVWNLGNPPRETWSTLDTIIGTGLDVFVDGKFITMFAFLFGLGIAQQWRRWEAVTAEPVVLHVRRMLFLLAIGLAHALLLRNGDILAPYALLGLVLPLFRVVSVRGSLIAAALLLAAPFLARAAIISSGMPWPQRPHADTGSYLADNLAWLRYWYATNPITVWPGVLSTILLGFAAGRARVLERIAVDPRLARRALMVAVPLAVGTWLCLMAVGISWSGVGLARGMVLNGIYHVNALALAGMYGAIVLVLSQRVRRPRAIGALQALGRMAFTNYLLQALLVVPFCLVTGLFDRVTPTRGLLLAIAVATIQVAFCRWWLARHEMGPFERLWRSATYGAVRAEGEGARLFVR